MKNPRLVQCAVAAVTLTVLSACGGSATVAPTTADLNNQYVGTSEVPVMGAHPRMRAMPRYPVIVPERKTRGTQYEYIINDYYTYASIFDYPKSEAQVGSISDVGGQGCTNVLYGYGKKIAWIVAAPDNIAEYRVPKKKIRALSESIGNPSSCAMDTTGNLAVGLLDGTGGGSVIVFKDAMGSGTTYPTTLSREYFDGYDSNGNLFADGFTRTNRFALIELPKGSSEFVTISTSNTVKFPGSVQWDGKYLTVTDQSANAVYQYTVSGTTATLEGTVQFTGSSDCAQTWNAGSVIYCADAGNSEGYVFNYPAGGAPIATFTGKFNLPLGTVASKK